MSLIDHLPTLHDAPPSFTPEQLTAYEHRRRHLSDAIDRLETSNPAASHHLLMRGLAVSKARDVIAYCLPSEALEQLELPQEHASEEPIDLPDVFLLARAADACGDRIIREALRFILSSNLQPYATEELAEALEMTQHTGEPIMRAYLTIMHRHDDVTERNLRPFGTQAPDQTAAWSGVDEQ